MSVLDLLDPNDPRDAEALATLGRVNRLQAAWRAWMAAPNDETLERAYRGALDALATTGSCESADRKSL